MLIHGYGVNATYMDKMAAEIIKEIPDAMVVSPQAPNAMALPQADRQENLHVPLPDEATAPPQGLDPATQREWFPITDSPAQMHGDLLKAAKKMNDFIDSHRDALGIGEQDIAIMGFSQGGAVALYTACTRDRQIACVAAHSTIVMDTRDFKSKPPALLIYGTADPVFSEERYQKQSILPLKGYLLDFRVETVSGLKHRTNEPSRRAVAAYIRDRLGGAGQTPPGIK